MAPPAPIERPSTLIVRYDISANDVFEHIANDCDNYHHAGFNLSSTMQHEQHVVAIYQKRGPVNPT